MPDFACRLKQLRIQNKITQKELATVLNVSQNAVFNWENGKREPSLSMIAELSNYFNVTVDYLLGKVNRPDTRLATQEDIYRFFGTDDEYAMIKLQYDKLNALGKQTAIERVKELSENPRYQKSANE